jgi:hypothetical protein
MRSIGETHDDTTMTRRRHENDRNDRNDNNDSNDDNDNNVSSNNNNNNEPINQKPKRNKPDTTVTSHCKARRVPYSSICVLHLPGDPIDPPDISIVDIDTYLTYNILKRHLNPTCEGDMGMLYLFILYHHGGQT